MTILLVPLLLRHTDRTTASQQCETRADGVGVQVGDRAVRRRALVGRQAGDERLDHCSVVATLAHFGKNAVGCSKFGAVFVRVQTHKVRELRVALWRKFQTPNLPVCYRTRGSNALEFEHFRTRTNPQKLYHTLELGAVGGT